MRVLPRRVLFALATSDGFERAVNAAPPARMLARRLASRYVAGATGQLAEDNLGRIQRLLIWAQFDNGAAHPINGGLSMSAVPQ